MGQSHPSKGLLAGLGALLLGLLGAPHATAPDPDPLDAAVEDATLEREAELERGALDVVSALPYSEDLEGILARRMLRVLVVPNRTDYFVERGTQRGLTYEAFTLFAQALERTHPSGERVHVVFVPVRRDGILEALRSGLGDVAATNLMVTPLEPGIAFTAPLFEGVDEIVVSAPDAPRLRSLAELAGQTVHVRLATSYFASLAALNSRLQEAGLAPMQLAVLPDELQSEDELEMLNAGLIQHAVIEAPLFEFWQQVFPDVVGQRELVVRRAGDVAWAVRDTSPKLRAALDVFLTRELREGSKHRNLLHARYLQSSRWVKPVAGSGERARYEKTVELFRRYGDRYGFDGLMLLAQAFQESRLDHSLVSPRGAVGLMQVMPATGRAMNVGDIHRPEHNVHAGVAYLRQLITTYFDEPQLSELDRLMFAFASYNAGPGRIQRLRAEAKRLGYSPDVWFGNVELVVADRFGREPVEYVRSILKYYVAYKRMAQEAEARAAARRDLEANAALAVTAP
jgi:membrane-bound lytic murein transglycosylase MltF